MSDVEAPKADDRAFVRELTPTWLATATLLSGQRPPDLSRPFRVAYLGSSTGATPSVIAAVHPSATVWAWDPRPSAVEATRRLRDAATLDNLTVHERPDLPTDLGATVDIVVVEGVIDSISDEQRAQVFGLIERVLRPGGLVALTYRTVVGWTEIAPVQRLIRYLATRDACDPVAQMPRIMDLLAQLAAGGASYLSSRPRVTAWIDDLRDLSAEDILAEYVERDLRPLSHAQVAEQLAKSGCHFVGSADLLDDLGLDIPQPLVGMIANAPTRTLRETFSDIALQRTSRCDLFRLGGTPLSSRERAETLATLPLVALRSPEQCEMAVPLTDVARAALAGDTIMVGDLDPDIESAGAVLRALMSAGAVHPLLHGEPHPDAAIRARSLSAAIAGADDGEHGALVTATLIGSAVHRGALSPESIERLEIQ